MAKNPKPLRYKIVGWRWRTSAKPAVRLSAKDLVLLERRFQQGYKNHGRDWADLSRNSFMKRKNPNWAAFYEAHNERREGNLMMKEIFG